MCGPSRGRRKCFLIEKKLKVCHLRSRSSCIYPISQFKKIGGILWCILMFLGLFFVPIPNRTWKCRMAPLLARKWVFKSQKSKYSYLSFRLKKQSRTIFLIKAFLYSNLSVLADSDFQNGRKFYQYFKVRSEVSTKIWFYDNLLSCFGL